MDGGFIRNFAGGEEQSVIQNVYSSEDQVLPPTVMMTVLHNQLVTWYLGVPLGNPV